MYTVAMGKLQDDTGSGTSPPNWGQISCKRELTGGGVQFGVP